MATTRHPKHNGAVQHARQAQDHLNAAAYDLLDDGKKLAHELYKDGLHRVDAAEDAVLEYSDKMLKKVKENPLASVLIAGGVGFILSALLRK